MQLIFLDQPEITDDVHRKLDDSIQSHESSPNDDNTLDSFGKIVIKISGKKLGITEWTKIGYLFLCIFLDINLMSSNFK